MLQLTPAESMNAFVVNKLLMERRSENDRVTLILNTPSSVWPLKTFFWKCSLSPAANTSTCIQINPGHLEV